jgi:transcriptional regulator with XRE-family HTH domain
MFMEDHYTHISLTLKALRKERGWSLDKTAQETGVSKAMLGQIERAESSPTIATLWKIASGFHVPFSLFISDSHTTPKTLHPKDSKMQVAPLFAFDAALKCEIFLIELLPGCEHLSTPHSAGVIEHVLVAEGSMQLLVDGVWKSLTKGEGLRFNANQAHGYRNITKQKAVIYDIIHDT